LYGNLFPYLLKWEAYFGAKLQLLLILNSNTTAEVDGSLAASLPALTGAAVFTFT
jgi:hypothetical protein